MTQFDGHIFQNGLVKNHQQKRALENLTSEKLTVFCGCLLLAIIQLDYKPYFFEWNIWNLKAALLQRRIIFQSSIRLSGLIICDLPLCFLSAMLFKEVKKVVKRIIKRRKEEMRQPEPVQVPQELAEETENEQIRATLRALETLCFLHVTYSCDDFAFLCVSLNGAAIA